MTRTPRQKPINRAKLTMRPYSTPVPSGPTRPLKKAHLPGPILRTDTPRASGTQPQAGCSLRRTSRMPGPTCGGCATLRAVPSGVEGYLGLFEQAGLQRVFWHPARRCDSSGQVNHTLENGFGMSIAISRRSLREAGRRVFREPPLLRTFLRTLGRGGSCSSS